MQVRHTNGKIYAVQDVPTLIKWIQDRRLARRCMVRMDEGDWMPILDIPEAVDAFDALESAAVEAPVAAQPEPGVIQDEPPSDDQEDPGDSPAAASADDLDALAQQAEQLANEDFSDPAMTAAEEPGPPEDLPAAAGPDSGPPQPLDDGDLLDSEPEPPEAPADTGLEAAFAALEQDSGIVHEDAESPAPADASFDDDDDPFALLDDDDGDSGGGGDLDDYDDLDEDSPKKSKTPLVIGAVAVLAVGGYFLFGQGGSGTTGGTIEMDAKHKVLIGNGINALLSGNRENMTKAMEALGPAVCQGDCSKLAHCTEVGDEKLCSAKASAAAYVPAFLLADRLFREVATYNGADVYLAQQLTTGLEALGAKKEDSELGKVLHYEKRQAFTHYYNKALNTSKAPLTESPFTKAQGELQKGEDTSGNTQLLLALQTLKSNDFASASKFIDSAEAAGANQAADPGLLLFTKARLERAKAKSDCAAAKAAYKAADGKSLGFAAREGAIFLASQGDLKGAAELIGASAGSDAVMLGLVKAAGMAPAKSLATLKNETLKLWVKNKRGKRWRYYRKKIWKPATKLPVTSLKRGDLLEQGQSMFPYQLQDLVEAGWIASYHSEDLKEAEAKKALTDKAQARFNKILALDPNHRDGLLGNAAMARHQAEPDAAKGGDFYAWLFAPQADGKPGACAPAPAPEAAPAEAATPAKATKKAGKRKRKRRGKKRRRRRR